MKIIICKGQLLGPISGADEILVNYAAHLHKRGHDVSVFLLYPYSPLDQYYRRLREAGVSVHTVASSSVGTFLRSGRKLALRLLNALPSAQALVRKNAQTVSTSLALRYRNRCRDFLKEIRPDVVHVLSPDTGAMVIISAAHDAGIPVMYQEVGIPYHPPGFESFYKQFTSVLPLCAEVTALSPLLAKACREQLPFSKKLSVLPIIVEDLRNGTRPARAEPMDITIGFAARIEHLKGPMVLLDAFAAASRMCRGLRLIIAGGGALKPQLAARSHELGVASQCEFANVYKSQLERQSFMQRLDVFALPSLTEGTPNSIIEAMSLGLPIVASDVGGIPDVVGTDAGILVPPGDSETLSRALLRLAEDAEMRRQMGIAAREMYEKLFSPEAVLPVLLETYNRISGRGLSEDTAPQKKPGLHPWEQAVSHIA
jgi:glycosyltransferase involved in cell wall biosynthesis